MTGGQAGALADRLGRRIDYLRVSVTDRCDLRCSYCIPAGHRAFCGRPDMLAPDEFARLVGLFSASGVYRIRLTGGEPLTRADLPEIAARIAALEGIEEVSLSTNATRLAGCAAELRAAGVKRLNVSLDTLDRQRFAAITGRDCLASVLRGLDAASAAGFFPVKINMVIQTDDFADRGAECRHGEIDSMVAFCRERGYVLRLIERMPIGQRKPVVWRGLQEIRQRLADSHGLVETVVAGGGPARYLGTPDGRWNVGFITPMSQHFCASCNRLRLSADGSLFTCLDSAGSVALGQVMRSGADDAALRVLIADAVWRRPAAHEFLTGRDRSIRVMSVTGG